MSLERLHPPEVPAGYPREFERELGLRDGRVVFVRPIVPDDAAELGWAIEHADPETLRGRFLGGPPHVTPELLTHLTSVDYERRFALVAADAATGQGIAVARYEWVEDDEAEAAVVVDPSWRRVGLATAMIQMLAEAALERGIHFFTAIYLAQNRPVAGLLELAGGKGEHMIKEGIAEFVVRLNGEDSGRPTA